MPSCRDTVAFLESACGVEAGAGAAAEAAGGGWPLGCAAGALDLALC